jgi:signal transduction histidine kinase
MSGAEVDFKLLFEVGPDVLLVLLPDAPRYTMVAATQARFAATHTTRDTLGRGLFELFPDNPDDPGATGMANLRASLERVRATRAADTMAVQKYDIRGPDGSFQVKYWSPRNTPVLSEQGEILYILHRVVDVTELVAASERSEAMEDRSKAMEREVVSRSRELAAANEQLREANAKLGELDTAKTAFFSNVSHEFRTPLTLMLGPLEDALAQASSDALAPAQRARLQLVHDNALRLLKLVNALLDFSRLEAGRRQAKFAPLELGGFTAELAAMFQSAATRSGIRLSIDCPVLPEPVWVDRDAWEKIVPNLISNAFKFTLAGDIAVRLRSEPERVVLEVADTGIGIPESEQARVFERFHRVEGTQGRTFEGTGIGLSLVRELVALHGGRVTLTSQVGRGSTFRVELPKGFAHLPQDAVSHEPVHASIGRDVAAHAIEARRWSEPPAAVGAAPTPSKAPSMPAKSGGRVLVVDDNADLRAYMAGLLEPLYEVSTAPDGQAALEAVRASPPDIVVSDVMMPRLDGFGLVQALRADPRTKSLPVILLSARAGEDAAIAGLAAGSDDYLVKPFSARELIARVRTHVELSRLRSAFIAELERTNQELDAFSYSVSHDLRAPLRAIDGFSQALAESCAAALDTTGHHYLERIRAGVRRMQALIDALLELARVTRAALQVESVDLSALAASVVADLRAAHPERTVELAIADGLSARADRRLLGVVLANLIGNAWKYTSRSAGARIEVGALDAAEPTYFVRDNGVGFDMRQLGPVFVPFQRFHAQQEFEGSGVGLATVQRAVARHRGRLWAEAAVGRGATFYFTLAAS